ncbi:DUF3329 domain-containing protein [Pleomorphochaeta sp. DL1XJH-081]|uniref:DUF3329 domain-containing protein n=1 Tax=Pleomorphochaeta sp. DL1XJH-081 TaxID=3409690 RepID=UPI003BB75CCD
MKKRFLSASHNQYYFVIIFSFLIIFILNSLTPYVADDYSYAFSVATGERIESISDIIKSQYEHWHSWGGRSIAHFLAQLFILLPKFYFNILNSLMYCAFIYLCYRHALGRTHSYRPVLLILLHVYFWIFLPVYGQNLLWLTGSCNYLWTTVLILLFVLPYRDNLEKNITAHKSFLFMPLLFLNGILAGWSNENSGASILVLLILYFFYKKYFLKVKIELWEIVGLIGFMVGFFLLISAPGNFNRLDEYNVSSFNITTMINRIYNLLSFYFRIGIIFPIIFTLPLLFNKNDKDILLVAYPLGALVAVFSMIVSPTFPDRATMIAYTYSGISLIRVLEAYKGKHILGYFGFDTMKIKLIALFYIIMVFSITSILPSFKNIVEVGLKASYRVEYIKRQRESNNENIKVGLVSPHNKHVGFYGLSDIRSDAEVWPNPYIAKYYSVENIVGIDDASWWPSNIEMIESLISDK